MSKSMDWQGRAKRYADPKVQPAQHSTPSKHPSATVRGQTKPSGDFMLGKGASSNVNLAVFNNRRVGHKGKSRH